MKPVGSSSQLTDSPLSPGLDGANVDINVVTSVRSVLDMSQSKYVEELMSATDVIDATAPLGHGSQHQHMGTRALEVT